MPGTMTPAIFTTTLSLSGVSPSSGTIGLTVAPPTGAFTDFGFQRGNPQVDPYTSWVVGTAIDNSSSSNFVRVWVTATAPVQVSPQNPDPLQRAAFGGIRVSEANMKATGIAYIDQAQFEAAPSTTLLPQFAEGYDDGIFYSLEPGVGALWERSQTRTLYGRYAGHFLQSPAYSGNSYQKVSAFASYNQLLAANRTYADVLNGPS
jgi:hypothetical protein